MEQDASLAGCGWSTAGSSVAAKTTGGNEVLVRAIDSAAVEINPMFNF